MSEQEWLDIFGDNLASILEEYGWTQTDLAKESGLSKAAISRYIRKKQMPNLKAIVNMAYAFEMNIDELINFDGMID